MSKIYIKALVKEINAEDSTLIGIASTGNKDRMNEAINQDGWQLDAFRKNPVMPWAHDYSLPPVAKIIDLGVVDGKLMFKAQFATKIDEFAAKIFQMYKEGYLNAFSVGFQPLERRDQNNTYNKVELLEISAVPVPANSEALAVVRAVKGIKISEKANVCDPYDPAYDPEACGKLNEVKGAVPFESTPTIDRKWDGAAAVQRLEKWAGGDTIDFSKFKRGFAWFDSAKADLIASYKLPHHDIVDGELTTNFSGVAAAMGALLGARGGVDIPESDRKAVYEHLAKHYAEYDKKPPEFRAYNADELAKLSLGLPSDYMLSFEHREKFNKVLLLMKVAADAMQEIANLQSSAIPNDGAGKAGSDISAGSIRIVQREMKQATKALENANRLIKIINPS